MSDVTNEELKDGLILGLQGINVILTVAEKKGITVDIVKSFKTLSGDKDSASNLSLNQYLSLGKMFKLIDI